MLFLCTSPLNMWYHLILYEKQAWRSLRWLSVNDLLLPPNPPSPLFDCCVSLCPRHLASSVAAAIGRRRSHQMRRRHHILSRHPSLHRLHRHPLRHHHQPCCRRHPPPSSLPSPSYPVSRRAIIIIAIIVVVARSHRRHRRHRPHRCHRCCRRHHRPHRCRRPSRCRLCCPSRCRHWRRCHRRPSPSSSSSYPVAPSPVALSN